MRLPADKRASGGLIVALAVHASCNSQYGCIRGGQSQDDGRWQIRVDGTIDLRLAYRSVHGMTTGHLKTANNPFLWA